MFGTEHVSGGIHKNDNFKLKQGAIPVNHASTVVKHLSHLSVHRRVSKIVYTAKHQRQNSYTIHIPYPSQPLLV